MEDKNGLPKTNEMLDIKPADNCPERKPALSTRLYSAGRVRVLRAEFKTSRGGNEYYNCTLSVQDGKMQLPAYPEVGRTLAELLKSGPVENILTFEIREIKKTKVSKDGHEYVQTNLYVGIKDIVK